MKESSSNRVMSMAGLPTSRLTLAAATRARISLEGGGVDSSHVFYQEKQLTMTAGSR